ncbi:hypothetical protein MSAN_00478300 [Mycena sanguinolenta]|uniref:Uncharacterized protein n=1 Tax=Mycena sanguinolenta TaxID=230812 RepID=A0A8H7DFR6_9AGAR|nr:hypothetical protein MSAN_00478300 [Mycena sanguinolenta]
MSEIVVDSIGSIHIPPSDRRGRSAHPFTFKNQPLSRPLKTLHATTFHRALRSQSYRVLYREQYDEVYRGEIRPHESCVEGVTRYLRDSDNDSDSDVDEPSPRSCPADLAMSAASSLQPASSVPAPTVTPSPRRLITYGKIGRKLAEARHVSGEPHTSIKKVTYGRGMTLAQVQEYGMPFLVPAPNQVHPLVDIDKRVVCLYAGAPFGQAEFWARAISLATEKMRSLRGNMESAGLTEKFVRVGIDFGTRGAYPHQAVNGDVAANEAQTLVASEEFRYIAAYQEHLLQRTAPRRHTYQALQMEELVEKQYHPAFRGSVFSTAEFGFGEPSTVMRRSPYDAFGSLRAITTLGDYSADGGWFLYWHEEAGECCAMHCPPGTTLLVPASVVQYGFSAIEKDETRFTFEQYFNAAVGRWLYQGFRSDAEYEEHILSIESGNELDWKLEISDRVDAQLALYSTLDELYV